MPVFKVTVTRRRTETRFVVEQAKCLIEAETAKAAVRFALDTAREEDGLDETVPFNQVSSDSGEDTETPIYEAVVEIPACPEGTLPDITVV